MTQFAAGTHKVVAGEFKFGETNNKSPYVAVILTGEGGETISATFFLTEKAYPKSAESLRTLGWTGENLETLDGLGSTEAYAVIAMEPSYKDPSKIYPTVKYINATADGPVGGAKLAVSKELDKSAVRDLAVKFGAAKSKKPGVPF